MSNSKTIAWKKLGELTGFGLQGIDYRTATTNSINRQIEIVKDEKYQDIHRRGHEMYQKSLIQKAQQDATKKLEEIKKKMIIIRSLYDKKTIIEDNCAICYDKFDMYSYNDVLTLGCDHTFHHSCIRNMLFIYMDDKCPLCRSKFKYKFKACRKTKKKLKEKILKYYSNECNRIEVCKLLELTLFLSEKDIIFGFLNDFIHNIRPLHPDTFLEMKYCELDRGHIYLFSDEYCGGDRSYKQHCECDH